MLHGIAPVRAMRPSSQGTLGRSMVVALRSCRSAVHDKDASFTILYSRKKGLPVFLRTKSVVEIFSYSKGISFV